MKVRIRAGESAPAEEVARGPWPWQDCPIKTVLLADLHLGSRNGRDLLRHATVRDTLARGIADADHVVLLGDVLELREGPAARVLEAATPVLAAIGRAAPEARFTVTAGNHDHRVARELIERARLATGSDGSLDLDPSDCPDSLFTAIARAIDQERVSLAYPGIWIREDVWATHGHYVDAHNTVPAFEAIAARVAARATRRGLGPAATEADYEAALSPVYSLLDALAESSKEERGVPGGGASVRLLARLRNPRAPIDPLKLGLERGLIPAAVFAINRIAGSDFRSDLSGTELRRAGLRAIGEVVDRLAPEAAHVVFGHTHRRGALAGDDRGEWRASSGAELHNCGSWVWEPWLVGSDTSNSPYWPGNLAIVEDTGAPRLVPLLDELPDGLY